MAASMSNRHSVLTAAALCLGLLVSGCVSAVKTAPEPHTDHRVEDAADAFFNALAAQPSPGNINAPKNTDVPVVRYGRYRLIEITPQAAQSDLMAQVVDISIPATFNKKETSVADGLRYVLMHSGYRLCATGDAVDVLGSLPLPAVHTRIGPMMLKDALETLAGSAWTMVLDVAVREVCFHRVGDLQQLPKNENSKTIFDALSTTEGES